jgi:hypothetical protein
LPPEFEHAVAPRTTARTDIAATIRLQRRRRIKSSPSVFTVLAELYLMKLTLR